MKKFDVNSFDVVNSTSYELYCYRYACLVDKYRKYSRQFSYVYYFMDILFDIGCNFSNLCAAEISFKTISSDQANDLINRYIKFKRRVMHRICNNPNAKLKK